MPDNVGADQLVIIRIEGMHCHRCEKSIQKALAQPGVHEVEVDFNSGQASVLYDQQQVDVKRLTDAISEAGYRVTGFTQRDDDGGQASDHPQP
jgi:copper chaperone CopZ